MTPALRQLAGHSHPSPKPHSPARRLPAATAARPPRARGEDLSPTRRMSKAGWRGRRDGRRMRRGAVHLWAQGPERMTGRARGAPVGRTDHPEHFPQFASPRVGSRSGLVPGDGPPSRRTYHHDSHAGPPRPAMHADDQRGAVRWEGHVGKGPRALRRLTTGWRGRPPRGGTATFPETGWSLRRHPRTTRKQELVDMSNMALRCCRWPRAGAAPVTFCFGAHEASAVSPVWAFGSRSNSQGRTR